MQLHASSNQSVEPDAPPSRESLDVLSHNFARLMRTAGRMKQQLAASAALNVEFAAQTLLSVLVNEGPLRASVLAEHAHSDPSTISRQVAPLIRDGLLERQVDQADGRASLLAVTEAGRSVHAAHVELRTQRLGQMLAGWSDVECLQFAGYLHRVTDAFDEYRAQLLADHVRPLQFSPTPPHVTSAVNLPVGQKEN